MAAPKRLFHVAMMVPETVLFDVTSIVTGKAFNLTITPVVETAAPATQNGKIRTRDVLEPWLANRETFSTKEAVALGKEHGLQSGAVNADLKRMVHAKIIKRITDGHYQVLVKPQPNGTAASDTGPVKLEHRTYILSLLNAKGPLLPAELSKAFRDEQRPVKSLYSALNGLMKRDAIRKSASGAYAITASGKKELP